MMYIPQNTALYFEQVALRVYRIVMNDLYTTTPPCMVDEAIRVIVGEDYFYELDDQS